MLNNCFWISIWKIEGRKICFLYRILSLPLVCVLMKTRVSPPALVKIPDTIYQTLWTGWRSNQSILKEINPEYSLEGLMLKAPILWLPDGKNWLIGKDPDTGKDWRQEEKVGTEDALVGWHHQLNRHEFEQIPRDSEGQGRLVCCSPSGHKESDMT